MKIVTIFGTRPEIIRLSVIIKRLDPLCDHVLVHTGQNWDEQLSDVFFDELGVRSPDQHLGIMSDTFGEQGGQIIQRASDTLAELRPDRMLVLGDTNSGLAALPAARMGIPVYHLEAGNRCYDDRVPEEINRRVIDHCSTVLMPYTERSKDNLVREGVDRQRIFVIGNPIFEVLSEYNADIERSDALGRLGLAPQGYVLVTIHRAENVDDPARLGKLLEGLRRLNETYARPVIVSLHPRTAAKMERFGMTASPSVRLLRPMGLFDFVALERKAMLVVTDSGTVQEECCIFGVPNVTVRDVTERPETIECGSNVLAGAEPAELLRAAAIALSRAGGWTPPPEYVRPDVSTAVAKIVLGHLEGNAARRDVAASERAGLL
jgi:UDP-N-acetylglucosamine 2-epimerase (non-hydrolysing)